MSFEGGQAFSVPGTGVPFRLGRAEKRPLRIFLIALLLTGGLLAARLPNFLVFHTISEIASIFVAWLIFVIAWNTRPLNRGDYLQFLGIAYLFVGIVDLVHTLAYKGMNLFPGYDANLPTQLWIAGRFLEAFSLLLAPLFLTRRLAPFPAFAAFGAVAALVLASTFAGFFPDCYLEGSGLTPFKIASEYVLCGLLAFSILCLYRSRNRMAPYVYCLMVTAVLCTIVSELAFTFYVGVYDTSNLVGHVFKVLSFYCVYLALVDSNLAVPYARIAAEEERFRHVLNATSDGAWDWNVRTGEVYWSPACFRMLGYEDREFAVTYDSWRALLHPDDRTDVVATVSASLESGSPFSTEFRLRRKDGAWQWILGRGCCVEYDPEGKPQRMAGTHLDLDHYKVLKRELESMNRLLSDSQRLTRMGSFVWSVPDGAVTWSEEMYRLLKYDPEEPLDIAAIHERIHHPDDLARIDAWLEVCLDSGVSADHENEYRLVCSDGTVLTVHTVLRVEYEEEKPVRVIGTCQDITERRRLEQKVLSVERKDAVGQLSGGIAHEFNNLLCGILGYADMLDLQLTTGVQRRYIRQIHESAERAGALTDQLLAFSGKGKYRTAEVDLNRIVTTTLQVLARTLDRRIEMEEGLSPEAALTRGDPSQLQNALLALALNARDAMPNGGTLRITTETVVLDGNACRAISEPLLPGRYRLLSVCDTGCGIAEEYRPRIFEPFFTTKGQAEAAGMGLAAVYGTILNHGGGITIDSSVGEGTIVRVYLPAVEAASLAAEEANLSDGAACKAPSILIVDDEEIFRALAVDVLEAYDCTVTVCSDGKEALRLLEREGLNPTLIVLDMIMPRLNGPDTFRAVRAAVPNARVLLSSGYALDEQSKQLLREGACGFLKKPFRPSRFVEAVEEALGCRLTPIDG